MGEEAGCLQPGPFSPLELLGHPIPKGAHRTRVQGTAPQGSWVQREGRGLVGLGKELGK